MKRVSSNLYILQNFNKLQRLCQPFLSIIPFCPHYPSSLQATKNTAEESAVSFSCSGSQDVSVVTPCLLLILTCSAGACYPRKRVGNLRIFFVCQCLPAFRPRPYPIESQLSWYTDFVLDGPGSGHTKKHHRGFCDVAFL